MVIVKVYTIYTYAQGGAFQVGVGNKREIKEAAKPQGILGMRQDGLVKVMNGVTSVDEVERAVGLDDLRG